MKLSHSILVILLLTLFSAGCISDGGFDGTPGPSNIDPPIGIDDPPIDDPEDPIAYNPFNQVRPIGQDPVVYAEVPNYNTLSGNGSTVLVAPAGNSRPDVDVPGSAFLDPDGKLVDCDIFSLDTADSCYTKACEDKQVCIADEGQYLTCGQVKSWVDELPTTCDALIRRAKKSCAWHDPACEFRKNDEKIAAIECKRQLEMRSELVLSSDCFDIAVDDTEENKPVKCSYFTDSSLIDTCHTVACADEDSDANFDACRGRDDLEVTCGFVKGFVKMLPACGEREDGKICLGLSCMDKEKAEMLHGDQLEARCRAQREQRIDLIINSGCWVPEGSGDAE